MSFWQRAALTASRVSDRSFGELMQILPTAQGRLSAPALDGARATRTLTGIYREIPMEKHLLDQAPGMGRELGTNIKLENLSVSFETGVLYVNGQLVLPEAGDRIVRTEIADAPQLEITSVKPDGASRHICYVVKAKVPL